MSLPTENWADSRLRNVEKDAMAQDSSHIEQIRLWPWLISAVAIILGLWSGCWIFVTVYFPKIENRGQFGDMFGAVNALFAGLAFAGVIGAIILQRNELRYQREELALQRKELELTRKEITGQKEQLRAQDQTLKKQNFENSFFQLLNFHNNIVSSLHIRGAGSSAGFDGRGCFAKFTHDLGMKFQSVTDIDDAWDRFAAEHHSNVDHYFRHLYNTVAFVDEHAFLVDFTEKKHYTNLIRGQLSTFELQLLFYNCLREKRDKFKCLVERYSFLEGIDIEVLLDPGHKSKYAPIAFGTTIG